MIEYPAMIYKTGKGYMANCMVKNFVGFGQTEEAAVNNLRSALKSTEKLKEFCIKPVYGLLLAQ